MKQATQLQIQWQEAPTVEPSTIDLIELGTASAISRLIPSILLIVKAIAIIAFCSALMFLAAILQG